MIYWNGKLRDAPSHKFLPVSALNLILMGEGIGPASKQSERSHFVAQERSDIQGSGGKFQGVRKAVLGSLAAMTVMSTVACAEEASKAQSAASNGEEATAEKIDTATIDDEWDLGFGEELAQKTEEAAQTTEELAQKTEEAAQKTEEAENEKLQTKAATDIADAAKKILN